jgi:hypothetical protein
MWQVSTARKVPSRTPALCRRASQEEPEPHEAEEASRSKSTLAAAAAFRLAQQRAAQVPDNYAIRGSYVGLSDWTAMAERTGMTLILRSMKKHMGWEDAKDD